MIKGLKKWASAIMLTALSASAIASQSPYILMQETADKLFKDIKESQSKIKQNPNYLKTIVKKDLMPHIHVKYAGKLVLGKNLSSLSDIQRNKFFEAFEKFVEQSYAQVLTQYTDQKIDVEKEKPLGDKTLVSIRVNVLQKGNSQPIKLDFKWRKNSKSGIWQTYDIAAEGVSMVATKQNEWNAVLRQKGIEGLIDNINEAAKQPISLK